MLKFCPQIKQSVPGYIVHYGKTFEEVLFDIEQLPYPMTVTVSVNDIVEITYYGKTYYFTKSNYMLVTADEIKIYSNKKEMNL